MSTSMLLSPQLRPPTALGRGSSRVAARCLHPGFGRTRPLRSAMPINAAAPTAAPVQGLASHAAGEDRARMGPSLGWERDFQQRYSIQELKGQGQFGKVYSAVLRSTGREVAVKVIPKQSPAGRHHHPAQDPAAHLQHHLQCIRDEVRMLAMCQGSSHVVRLEGLYEDDEQAYIVMELCEGGDLRSMLQRGPLGEREAAEIMHAVLDVIHECHTHHHSYGDVKPANFMLLHGQQQQQQQQGNQLDLGQELHGVEDAHVVPPCIEDRVAGDAHCNSGPVSFSISSIPGDEPVEEAGTPVFARPSPAVVFSANVSTMTIDQPAAMLSTEAGQQHASASKLATGQGQANNILSGRGKLGAGSGPVAAGSLHNVSEQCADASPALSSLMRSVPLPAGGPTAQVVPAPQPMPEPISSTSNSTGPASQATQATATNSSSRSQAHRPLAVRAVDFGCSQRLTSRSRCSSTAARRVGSPVFMAPELWQSSSSVGLAIDVWAAGVMCYLLLSGRYPFWKMSPDQVDHTVAVWQVVCASQSSPVLLEGEPWEHVSHAAKDLILAMLNRQPAQRITALEALAHPWFRQQLGYTPRPTSAVNPYASLSLDSEEFEDIARLEAEGDPMDSLSA